MLLTTGLSFGQSLQNGSFENGYTNWAPTGHQAIATNDPAHPASDGSKVVVFNINDLLADATLSQTFATTPGQRYDLAIDVGTVGAIADQRLEVVLQGNGNLLDQILTVSSPDAGAFYMPQHISFVANSSNTSLTFRDASITYYVIDLLIDNVEITPVSALAPLITSPPVKTAAATGRSATFSVTASGSGTLSYQWRFDGNPISGANSNSYTIAAVNAGHAGIYDVIVTNDSGATTSSAVSLTILPPGILLNGSFEYGPAAWTFTGAADVSTNVNYGVTDGAQLAHFNFGQQTPTGVLTQSFATTVGQTYVLAFDTGTFSFQSTAEQRLQVKVQGSSTLVSQTVSMFAQGTGTWYYPKSYAFVANSSTTTLTFQDVSPETFDVDLLLDNVRITLQSGIVITSQPQSATVTAGSPATFSVTATGQPPLSYQWRFNGGNIAGANSSSYTINNAQIANAGNYDVVVSNSSGSVTSATAVLTILPAGIIANGSFEFDYAGWSATGNQQIVTPPLFQVTDGAKAVAFNAGQATPNGVLSQTFTTTIGQSYTLSFDMGAQAWQSNAEQRLQVTLQGSGTLVSQTASVFAQGTGAWYTTKSYAFVADSSTTTLTFQDVSQATTNVDVLLDNVRVTLQNGIVITSQPQSTIVTVGNSATFSVTAAGQPPLSYQWRFNGGNIAGANSSSYTINNAQIANAGNYDVVVSNSSGSVTSATAVLTVLPPSIIINGSFELGLAGWTATGSADYTNNPLYEAPDGTNVLHFNYGQLPPDGTLAQTFSTVAGQVYQLQFYLGTVSYQNFDEQRLEVDLTGNGVLLSQTMSLFAQGTGAFYTVKTFTFTANTAHTTISFFDRSQSTFNVDVVIDDVRVTTQDGPGIVTQPQSVAVQAGDSATFSVTAAGQPPLSYQWRFNGGNIAGANASSYTINNAQVVNAGNYDVIVSNSSGSITSATAILTILPPGIIANGSFEFDYAGWSETGNQQIGTPPLFQVTDGSKAVAFNAGQATPNGVLSQTFATTIGQSYVLNFDMGAQAWQSNAEQRLQVTLQGSSTLVSQIASVFAQGTGAWYTPKSYAFVANSSTTTLTFQDISQSTTNVDALLDNVRVTLQNGIVITSQPQSATVTAGSPATFSVTATGQPPLSYQWRFNGGNIAGANASSYTINNAQVANAGNYDVVVSNSSGSVTSATAVLTILPAGIIANGSFEFDYAGWSATGNQQIVTPPLFQVTDGAKAVAFNAGQATPNGVLSQSFATTIGQSYVLSFDMGAQAWQSNAEQRLQVTLQGSSTLVSQTASVFAQGTGAWYTTKSYAFVANSATTTLTFQDVSQATTNVDVLLDNVRVTLQNGIVITSQPQSVAVQAGNNATFSVMAAGQSPLSYQWRFNGGNIAGATSSSYTINNAQVANAGNYDVVVSNPSDSVTSAMAVLTILPPGIIANGSFEFDYAGWSETGNQQIVSPPLFQVTDGNKAVVFNAGQTTPNGVLSQSFATTIGQSYVLSFDMGATGWQTNAEQRLQVTVQGSSSLVSQTASVFGQGTGAWYTTKSYAFVANSATTTLTFQDVSQSTTNVDVLLDNVQVTVQGGAQANNVLPTHGARIPARVARK